MSQRIPDRLDPWRYADLGKAVSGTVRLDELPRLSRCLLESEGEARFDLRFDRDAERRATLTGRIEAELVIECQRCLEAMRLPFEIEMAVAFVEGVEQAGRLPEALDPCLVEEGRILFRDLIEDELLLMLPQVAMHEPGACPTRLGGQTEEKPVEPENERVENPFAVLAELKRDKD